ncbi:MAG: hypothetical protein QM296_05845 [Bacillota bacterium]|nr:hypothetical protein [Bacillota bacterium]
MKTDEIAPESGQERKNLSRGGQNLRWCPGIGAETKKLTRGGQHPVL